MSDYSDTDQENNNKKQIALNYIETTFYQQSIIKNEKNSNSRKHFSQKLYEYKNEIRKEIFFKACEQARQSLSVFKTRFFFKDKLMQIIEKNDSSLEICDFINIEKYPQNKL